jgi:SnoaL-like domain
MEFDMTDAAYIADRYIEVWNETDLVRRNALLADGWCEDATYVDPLMRGDGRDRIGALIGGVHERFPGFRFTLDGCVDGYGDKIRFSWALGPSTSGESSFWKYRLITHGPRVCSSPNAMPSHGRSRPSSPTIFMSTP